MGRRTAALIASLLVAALGTVAVFLYAQNARNQGVRTDEATTDVLVASAQIAVGTTGAAAASLVETRAVRTVDVTPGALTDPAQLTGLVATVPIFAGQQLLAAQWGTSNATGALTLPPGTVAMTVQLGDPQRVAGFVSPGSTVAILTTGTDGVTHEPYARTLLSGIPVVGVGQTTSGTDSDAADPSSALVTLAVNQRQAEQLLFAQANGGGLTMALMNNQSKVTPGDGGITNRNLFG